MDKYGMEFHFNGMIKEENKNLSKITSYLKGDNLGKNTITYERFHYLADGRLSQIDYYKNGKLENSSLVKMKIIKGEEKYSIEKNGKNLNIEFEFKYFDKEKSKIKEVITKYFQDNQNGGHWYILANQRINPEELNKNKIIYQNETNKITNMIKKLIGIVNNNDISLHNIQNMKYKLQQKQNKLMELSDHSGWEENNSINEYLGILIKKLMGNEQLKEKDLIFLLNVNFLLNKKDMKRAGTFNPFYDAKIYSKQKLDKWRHEKNYTNNNANLISI